MEKVDEFPLLKKLLKIKKGKFLLINIMGFLD
jgi:hypothetical protein